MTSSSIFQYCSRSKFELSYLLSNLPENWHRGQFGGADFEFEPKNPIRIHFEREKYHFYEKLKISPKCPLTKALPWQHYRLLSTKTIQMIPYIIILKVRKFHQPTENSFGTARKKPVGAQYTTRNQVQMSSVRKRIETSEVTLATHLTHPFIIAWS